MSNNQFNVFNLFFNNKSALGALHVRFVTTKERFTITYNKNILQRSCQPFVLKIREISKQIAFIQTKTNKCTRGCGRENFETRQSHDISVRVGNYATIIQSKIQREFIKETKLFLASGSAPVSQINVTIYLRAFLRILID